MVSTMNTNKRHRVVLQDGSTVMVNRLDTQPGAIFSDVHGWRRAYGYVVRDAQGNVVARGKDLHGPSGRWTNAETPSSAEMLRAFGSFLGADAERYQCRMEGTPLQEWAYMNEDEISMIELELEGQGGGR